MPRFVLQSPCTWLTQMFNSPKLQAMLAAWGIHLDFVTGLAMHGPSPQAVWDGKDVIDMIHPLWGGADAASAMIPPPAATGAGAALRSALYGLDKSIQQQFAIWLAGVMQGFRHFYLPRLPVLSLV